MPEANINFVNFKVGTSTAYAALSTKDANTLYFLSDTLQIMKGEDDYSALVIYADTLPTVGIKNKLYLVGKKASIYTEVDGTDAWQTVWDLDEKADLSGATFTGSVILAADPTQDLEAATKQYVDRTLASADAMRYKGTVGTGGTVETLPTEDVRQGDTYKVAVAGTYAGVECEVGDMIIALADIESGASDSDWTVVQGNIDGAVTGPASSTAENLPVFDNTTGKVIKDSGKKIGGATFEETPSDSTLATEAGVQAAITDSRMVWTEI